MALMRGIAASLVAKGLSLACAFGMHLVLARHLGVEAYGAYALVVAWAVLLGQLCPLGLDRAGARFVAVLRAQASWALLRGYVRRSAQVTVGASLLTCVLAAGALWALGGHVTGDLREASWAGLPLIVLLSLLSLRSGVLRGAKQSAAADMLTYVVPGALVMSAVPLLVRSDMIAPRATSALIVYVAALLCTTALSELYLRYTFAGVTWSARPAYAQRTWFAVSLPSLAVALSGVVLIHTDLLVVGSVLGVHEAGLYSAAWRLSRLPAYCMVAVESAAAPFFAELHAGGASARLARAVRLTSWVFVVIAVCSSAALLGLGTTLLQVFGPEFRVAFPALAILLAGQLMGSPFLPARSLLLMTGHERAVAVVTALAVGLCLSLNLLLVPRWGIVGAAAASSLTLFLADLVMFVMSRQVRRVPAAAQDG